MFKLHTPDPLPFSLLQVLKSEIARFNASQLITQRERVSRLIRYGFTWRNFALLCFACHLSCSFLPVHLPPPPFLSDNLKERAMEFWIVLDDVSITDLSFGTEYSRAVEAKQVAQQEAQRAAMLVERAKQERQQKIVEAEGEAQSAKLIGEVRCWHMRGQSRGTGTTHMETTLKNVV